MRNQLLLKTWGKRPAHRYFAGTSAVMAILFLSFVAGCGGSSSTSNVVAAVNVTPATISMGAGDVVTITPSAVNSSNGAVNSIFTFNSSNTGIATVSPAGQVCGGVWDSIFVVCKGTDASGNPIAGTATITVTAGGVTSGPVSVAVHPSITSISVDAPPAGCFSTTQTHQFVPHAFHNGVEITNQVGNFNWTESDGSVVSVDANGLATAGQGGMAGVVASLGSTTSPAQSFQTCLPVLILLHIAGDSAGFNFSKTMNIADTQQLQVDLIDENGVVTANAPFNLISNNPAVATVLGAIVTAQSSGGAGIVAACAPPHCGDGLNIPIYGNLFSISVNGISPNTTTVYAASSFSPPLGNTIPLIPIDASQNPPKAGTAIPLPGVPNSIVFDRSGVRAYIGTNAGLAVLDATANIASLVTPVAIGKVLAVSADGTQALVSNSANDPSTGAPIDQFASEQRLWLFNQTTNTITTFIVPGIVAATFDEDGFKAYGVGDNGKVNVAVVSPLVTQVTTNIPGVNRDVTTLSSGPFVYVANSSGLEAIATCNNVLQTLSPPTNTTTIQLVGSVRNADQIVAVDSTGLDIETVTTSTLIPPLTFTTANCQQNVSYSNKFIDFGLGPITAHQLLIGTNGSHIVVLPTGIDSVLTAIPGGGPGSIALAAGSTEPTTGGLTPDGNTLWVGVAGTNTVDRINLLTSTDEVQIPMTTLLVKSDGSPAPPDLVALKPK
jgi:trimeric autotransporter adhesin